jgi:hypothetical protein
MNIFKYFRLQNHEHDTELGVRRMNPQGGFVFGGLLAVYLNYAGCPAWQIIICVAYGAVMIWLIERRPS